MSGPVVLLVEDSATVARAAGTLLGREGVAGSVVVAGDAEDAYARLTSDDGDRIGLVVLDLALPGRQGLELLADIRAHPTMGSLPVVIFSGSSDPEAIRRSYALGANCFVRKPRVAADLDDAVTAIARFWTRWAQLPSVESDADRVEAPFPAETTSIPAARAVVRKVLERWGVEALVDDAMLCTSELVTNAIVHGASPCVVSIVRLADGVRVEVFDEGGGEPEAEDAPEEATRGRGLALVDFVSRAWGVASETPGKAVWFELDLPRHRGTVATTSPPG